MKAVINPNVNIKNSRGETTTTKRRDITITKITSEGNNVVLHWNGHRKTDNTVNALDAAGATDASHINDRAETWKPTGSIVPKPGERLRIPAGANYKILHGTNAGEVVEATKPFTVTVARFRRDRGAIYADWFGSHNTVRTIKINPLIVNAN